MSLAIDRQRIFAALETARSNLLAERTPDGHWVGELSSSPLATATAISALVIAEQYGRPEQHGRKSDRLYDASQIFQSDLSELIVQSLHWLACHQNEDGGWGDTDRSRSNIAATTLVNAAFHLTGVPAKYSGLLERAEKYLRHHGGVTALRKHFGRDKSFAAPVLANCALAGLVPWKEVTPLPFELAAIPQSWLARLRMGALRLAIPALVATGQGRFHHQPPWNPLTRLWRRLAQAKTLQLVEKMQPASGGFLEATPLTSFVVMNLASIGLAEHPVVRRGVEFLLSAVRGDGSWPIDSNLAVWNTSLAMNALLAWEAGDTRQGTRDSGQETVGTVHATGDRGHGANGAPCRTGAFSTRRFEGLEECVEWLLNRQQTTTHPHSGAAPGGWSCTELAGGVPDVADTSGSLFVLAAAFEHVEAALRRRIECAARRGVRWLLDVQNRDGGWPTFCRGWGYLPFDRSGSDLTAHALQALCGCRSQLAAVRQGRSFSLRLNRAVDRGLAFLQDQQREDGSWVPLWFGNQGNSNGENPVYGTSRVLIALAEVGYGGSEMVRRGSEWLCRVQHASGGWGSVVESRPHAEVRERSAGKRAPREVGPLSGGESVEETALAVTALLRVESRSAAQQTACEQGLAWLMEALNNGRDDEAAPIGFYLGRMWYYERLYPQIFAAEALQVAASAVLSGERIASHYPTPCCPHAEVSVPDASRERHVRAR